MTEIPAASAFSPISELVSKFGIPNPLEFLDKMGNDLEGAKGKTAEWRAIAGEMRGISETLRSSSEPVRWHGDGGKSADEDTDERLGELEDRIEELEKSAEESDSVGEIILKVIKTILIIITVAATVLAALILLALSTAPFTFGFSLAAYVTSFFSIGNSAVAAIFGMLAAVASSLYLVIIGVEMWLA